jgi:hypothetical protein
MKYLLAAIAIAALTTPSLAFDKPAFEAAKQQWKSDKADWKVAEEAWKADGKPDPKPEKPAKPDRSLY